MNEIIINRNTTQTHRQIMRIPKRFRKITKVIQVPQRITAENIFYYEALVYIVKIIFIMLCDCEIDREEVKGKTKNERRTCKKT